MEFPMLEVKLEPWLPAYATATTTSDLNHVCDLHHSSWQHQILNPLSEARDQTPILMDTSHVHHHWAMKDTLYAQFLDSFIRNGAEFCQKLILHLLRLSYVFILQFVDMVYHTN